jgi:hypothetical protein
MNMVKYFSFPFPACQLFIAGGGGGVEIGPTTEQFDGGHAEAELRHRARACELWRT